MNDSMTLGNSTVNVSLEEASRPDWLPPGYPVRHVPAETCETHREFLMFRAVVDIFVVGLLCVLGLLGNTLSILVLRADNINNTMTFLLQALAVVDSTYLVGCLFIQVFNALCECTDWTPGFQQVYPYIEPYTWPLASMAQTSTVWLVVLVTTDRYFAICRPFETLRLCTLQRAKRAVAVIIICAILYNIPRFFEKQVMLVPDYCNQKMRMRAVPTDFRRDRIYIIVYKTVMYFVFRLIVPLFMLAVLNLRLLLTLRGARRNRAILTKSSPKTSDAFTVILVAVVTVFIMCALPDFIVRSVITIMTFTGSRINLILLSYTNVLTNLLLTLNSSINCLIYCLTGRRFRKILYRLLFKQCYTGSDDKFTVGNEFSENSMTRVSRYRLDQNSVDANLINGCQAPKPDKETPYDIDKLIKPEKETVI